VLNVVCCYGVECYFDWLDVPCSLVVLFWLSISLIWEFLCTVLCRDFIK